MLSRRIPERKMPFMVKIVLDSTTDISPREARELGVYVAPLTVTIDGNEYRDGVDLTPAQFFEKLQTCKSIPTTSQVNSAGFMDLFKSLLSEPEDEILGIFISSRLSGTFQSASIARNTFPRHSIHLVDSGSGSFGTDLLVREALRLRDQGCRAEEIARELNRIKDRVRILATLDTLKFLLKGGRLSPTSAIVGTLLHVKPIMGVSGGKIEVVKKVRGTAAAHAWIASYLSQGKIDPRYTPRLGSAQCPELLRSFTRCLKEKGLSPESWGHTDIGAVIGTHTGPGCVGVAYIERP